MVPKDEKNNDHKLDQTSITVSFLKHELRTSICHIIGYSEMLLEDLRENGSPEEIQQIEAIFSLSNGILNIVNARFTQIGQSETSVSTAMLAEIRSEMQVAVGRIFELNLDRSDLATKEPYMGDIGKILDAAGRLREFAQTGNIRT